MHFLPSISVWRSERIDIDTNITHAPMLGINLLQFLQNEIEGKALFLTKDFSHDHSLEVNAASTSEDVSKVHQVGYLCVILTFIISICVISTNTCACVYQARYEAMEWNLSREIFTLCRTFVAQESV